MLGSTAKIGPRGRVHAFPFIEEDPTGPIRTDTQNRQYALMAHSRGTPVCL